MIYTLTFNPAVDLVLRCDKLNIGTINRVQNEFVCFGGKGINVSQMLAQLGVRSRALGFVAGFTGAAIEQGLRNKGIETDFVQLDSGFSRINVKLKAENETEINGRGPDIEEHKLEELFERLDRLCAEDTLVLAGSVPDSLPNDIYEQILARLDGKGVRAVVDASGKLLLNVLKYRPWLIKPNKEELLELFGEQPQDTEQISRLAQRLREMGAQNVLVSMAGDGALLLDSEGRQYTCGVCKGTVLNSVGAGDSMVAGFIAGAERGFEHALKLGTACGGATAFSSGIAEKELIFELLKQL